MKDFHLLHSSSISIVLFLSDHLLTTFLERSSLTYGIVSCAELVKRAKKQGKRGVSVLTDAGAFYLFEEIQKFVEYEQSLPIKYHMNLKRFCICSQSNFNRLTEEQKQKILSTDY